MNSINQNISLMTVLGMPRSGTSLLFRELALDSSTYGIMEPYQQRRDNNYGVTELNTLIEDSSMTFTNEECVLVKETTTRIENVRLLNALLFDSANHGRHCTSIVILRSPFETFLSQVNASQKYWKQKKMVDASEVNFNQFFTTSMKALNLHLRAISNFSLRVTTYNRLTQFSDSEISRLIASQGRPYKKIQKQTAKGGDPKLTETKSIKSELSKWPIDDLKLQINNRKLLGVAQEFCELATISDYSFSDRELFEKLLVVTSRVI